MYPNVISNLTRFSESPHLLLLAVEEIEAIPRETARIQCDEFRVILFDDGERFCRRMVVNHLSLLK